MKPANTPRPTNDNRSKAATVQTRSDNAIVPTVVPHILQWYSRHARDLPWRRTSDPYAIWISEVMLQQTRVETVRPFFHRWIQRLPTLHSLARARPDTVLKLWEGLGYYRRPRALQDAARLVLQHHDGRIPDDPEILRRLPGIGRYTAGAISSIAYNRPAPVLDGNIVRLLARLRGIRTPSEHPRVHARLWSLAESLVRHAATLDRMDPRPCAALNQALMELGATVCLPRTPRCDRCPLQTHCVAHRTAATDRIPARTRRPNPTERRVAILTIRRGRHFLVRRRPAGTVNGRLWEFPSVPLEAGASRPRREKLREFGASHITLRNPWLAFEHSITRYRIRVQVHLINSSGQPSETTDTERWCTVPQLDRLPMSAAHRRVARNLQRLPVSSLPQTGPRQGRTNR